MTQLHKYIDTFFSIFFSIMVYHRILNIVPCTIVDLIVHPFYIYQFASANPKLPIHPSPTPLPLTTTWLFSMSMILFLFHRYICEFVSYFRFYIQVISDGICLSLSDLLHLV